MAILRTVQGEPESESLLSRALPVLLGALAASLLLFALAVLPAERIPLPRLERMVSALKLEITIIGVVILASAVIGLAAVVVVKG